MCNSKANSHQFSMLLRYKESKTDWFWKLPNIWVETTLELLLLTLPKVSLEDKKSMIPETPSPSQLVQLPLEEL